MKLEDLQTQLIQDGQRLSKLASEGSLTMEEWQRSLDSWEAIIPLLPENQRDAMDLEFFHLIKPEES